MEDEGHTPIIMKAKSVLTSTGNVLGNLLFFIFGGFFISLSYIFGGLLLCLTIIGIPFGYQCIKLGIAMLAPFGLRFESSGKSMAGSIVAAIFNVIWALTFGIVLALEHCLCGIFLAITIIGLPLATQHFKLITLAFAPFGKTLTRN